MRATNLWVGNAAGTTIVEFAGSQLAASGATVPTATISDNGTSLKAPEGIAFDATGNLWVTELNLGVMEFALADLKTGSPAPTVVLTGLNGSGPGPITFNPHAAGLPINGAARRSEVRVR